LDDDGKNDGLMEEMPTFRKMGSIFKKEDRVVILRNHLGKISVRLHRGFVKRSERADVCGISAG
jgi:hypothetical protein